MLTYAAPPLTSFSRSLTACATYEQQQRAAAAAAAEGGAGGGGSRSEGGWGGEEEKAAEDEARARGRYACEEIIYRHFAFSGGVGKEAKAGMLCQLHFSAEGRIH